MSTISNQEKEQDRTEQNNKKPTKKPFFGSNVNLNAHPVERKVQFLSFLQYTSTMSLITKQLLLESRSDRNDVLRRISFGDDTPNVKQMLNGINKKIAKLEQQLADETSKFHAQRDAASAKADNSRKPRDSRPRSDRADRPDRSERAPLPEDLDMTCGDCTNAFTFTGKDQIFFTKNGWDSPSRCTDCRDARKNTKPSGKSINCSGCKIDFTFSDAKSRIFEERGWTEPKRCKDCSAEQKSMAPLVISCSGCKSDFTFSVSAQKSYKVKGWVQPKTCRTCHTKKTAVPVATTAVATDAV
jgi:hypothetical protein